MIKISFIAFIVLLVFGVCGIGAMDLAENAVYDLPGFTGRINTVQFAASGLDLAPEILASDGSRIMLFSALDGAILYDASIEAGYLNYTVLLDDIDCDLESDIIIGYYFKADEVNQDTVGRVELLDGAGLYTSAESLYFEASAGSFEFRSSPFGLANLQALDITGDGCRELVVGHDRYTVSPLISQLVQTTVGETRVYADAPDQIEWQTARLLSRLYEIPAEDDQRHFAATRLNSFSVIPGSIKITGGIEIITEAGAVLAEIDEPMVSVCTGDSSRTVSILECLTVGDIDPFRDGPEILCRYSWRQTCYSSDQVSFDSSSSFLRLYYFQAPDQLTPLWTRDDFSGEEFYYSDLRPGYFFSINGQRVSKHSGIDGSVADESNLPEADTLMWCGNPSAAGGELVAVKDQTVTVYGLDISTDAEDNNRNTILPGSFELGMPYPNPFNPSCVIEYSLPTRSHVKISIVDILGRSVATLHDGVKPAGAHTAVWNGTDHDGRPVASGVYFCRMESGAFSQSRKMLLLK